MTAETFHPTLTSTDWNEEWKALQIARKKPDNAHYWDERAKTFHTGTTPSPYVKAFLNYTDIRDGEQVFDMGCGNGALAIPLAHLGHKVLAADFSQGMLNHLMEDANALKLTTITPICMSWSDDWAAHGVTDGCVNVAVASRSIVTADLRDSLIRLTRVARRRCAITLPTGSSPRTDKAILEGIGMPHLFGQDFVYAFMILIEMGYLPEVRYISSERYDTFDNAEQAYEELSRMVEDAALSLPDASEAVTASYLEKLKHWISDNLVSNPEAGEDDGRGKPQKSMRLRKPRTISWGFIAWDVAHA